MVYNIKRVRSEKIGNALFLMIGNLCRTIKKALLTFSVDINIGINISDVAGCFKQTYIYAVSKIRFHLMV